jgi:hypothetical protein
MTTPITAETESRLMEAGKTMVRLTNEGSTPDSALQKVAKDNNFGPDFVERLAQMYNTSRTLKMMKEAGGETKRTIDHPLADASAVISELFSDVGEKSASVKGNRVTASLDHDPMTICTDEFVKAASAEVGTGPSYIRDPHLLLKRAYNIADAIEKEAAALASEVARIDESRLVYLQKAASYFRSMYHDPFAEVEQRIKSAHAELGSHAMDAVWAMMDGARKLEKRAEEQPSRPLHVPNQSPYKEIEEVIKLSCAKAKAKRRAAAAKASAKEYKAEIKKRAQAIASGKAPAPTKQASFVGALQFKGVNEAIDSLIGKDDEESAKAKAISKSVDPVHESNLRSIRAQSNLSKLLAEDPVISQYDPQEVTTAYNEISQLAPRTVTQPSVLRGYLRRFLESSPQAAGRTMDTFEVDQLAGLESKMPGAPMKEDVIDPGKAKKKKD